MALICLECLNSGHPQIYFLQISSKYKGEWFSRSLKQASNGLHRGKWESLLYDGREDGFYCSRCSSRTSEDAIKKEEKIYLQDLRIKSWGVEEFPLEESVRKLKGIAHKTGAEFASYRIPARKPVYADLHSPFPQALEEKRIMMGFERLYSHQAEAINHLRKGRNAVVTTSTASGKSLIYTLPILESLLDNQEATALYLSPLKALTYDQLQALTKWDDRKEKNWDGFGFQRLSIGGCTFGAGCLQSGDPAVNDNTYAEARYWMTNLHFLHMILRGPMTFKHKKDHMISYFKNLKYVVLDEVHAYEGVLGTKVAMVIRRLKNLCRYLGNPHLQFIACSGTIGNPAELAAEITGSSGKEQFICIEEDGSPQHEKEILLWNPGMLSAQTQTRTRRAPLTEALDIIRSFMEEGTVFPKVLMFMDQKKVATQTAMDLNKYLLSALAQKQVDELPAKLFAPFHANLTAFNKQETMDQLKNNELMGIVSTSALAMGIDIGDLNICFMAGYPGSKANFIQQAGRVGRKGPGIVIMLFKENPLEQYFAAHPDEFMEREAEHVTIDVKNPAILNEHLKYAAFETGGKIRAPHNLFKISAAKKIQAFRDTFTEPERGTIMLKSQEEVPFSTLIKSGKQYKVYHVAGYSKNELFSNIDERQMLRDYHIKAVFLHNDMTYRVTRILEKSAEIHAVPARVEYTTRSKISDSLVIETRDNEIELFGLETGRGTAEVTRHLWGFIRHYFHSASGKAEALEESPMRPVKFKTDAVWICLPKDIGASDAGLHAAEHAMASAIPMVVKCSLNDIAHHSGTGMKQFPHTPAIVFYETGGGGAGITHLIQSRISFIIQKARQILQSCQCSYGCPNCTHLSNCEKDNQDLDKQAAIHLLETIGKRELTQRV